MFTGIVQEVGRVIDRQTRGGALRFSIEAKTLAGELNVDDSICVSGVCLTVVERSGHTFQVEAVEETLRKTTLGQLQRGDRVNLEPSLRLADRMGGHFVQGHVDAVGQVTGARPQAGGRLLKIKIPAHLQRYVISEGSIAIDGVSLTVARLNGNEATISLIPHTLEKTTLANLRSGDKVNIEVDMIGKYVEKLMSAGNAETLSEQALHKMGYE